MGDTIGFWKGVLRRRNAAKKRRDEAESQRKEADKRRKTAESRRRLQLSRGISGLQCPATWESVSAGMQQCVTQ